MRAQLAPNASGDGERVIGVLMDITDRKRAEQRFREMADNAPIMIWISDPEDRLTFMSRSWEEFTGQAAEAALGRGWLESVHPDDRARVAEQSRIASAGAGPFAEEYRLRHADGGWRWVMDAATPRHDSDRTFLGHIGSIVDITGRKMEEERRMLLLQELRHRVKNTLALVQSIVSQTLREAKADPSVSEKISARLVALAASHETLATDQWQRASFGKLVQELMSPFDQGQPSRVMLQGPDIGLEPRAAMALSLGLHELATNAAKYGSLSVPDGHVSIEWEVEPAGGLFTFTWKEGGGPAVTRPVKKGFGSRLFERAIALELSATIDLDFDPAGLQCRIVAPAARIGQPPGIEPDLEDGGLASIAIAERSASDPP